MKYCIINYRDNEMKGYQSSLDGSDDNLISMMTMMMSLKASLGCSFSYFGFYSKF